MGVATKNKVICGGNTVEVENLGDMSLAEVLATAEKMMEITATENRTGVFVDGKPGGKVKQKIQPGQEVEIREPAGQFG